MIEPLRTTYMLAGLFAAGIWAGAQNALAGGGSFVTLPALIASGLDARGANVASTLALFPGQTASGAAGFRAGTRPAGLGIGILTAITLVGGALGALLLLYTPPRAFASAVPYLVLFATAMFAWSAFRPPRPDPTRGHMGPRTFLALQFLISIYGGYFGGGIGFLMLAVLSAARVELRGAAGTKNYLAALMNASAVVIFALNWHGDWHRILALAAGAVVGGWLGALWLQRIDARMLRIGIVILGLALTVGLFLMR